MSKSLTQFPMRSLSSAGVKLLDCDHRTPKPYNQGFPYIAIPDIKNGHIDLAKVRLISKEDYHSWTRKTKPQTGDIILTRRGRVGDTATVTKGLECAIGQDLVILRSDEKQLLQSFLRWALRGPLYEREVQKYLNVGAIFDSLNCGDIPKFEIPVPSIAEQSAISDILDSLDSKIRLNQQINKTLEAIGQAVFRRWFVDFEFPDGEGKPYRSSGGEMVYSQEVDKEIPKRWTVAKLGSYIDLGRGLSYKGAFLSEEGSPMINLGTFAPNAGFIPEGIKHYTGDYKKNQLVKAGDIVIANTDITQKREVLGSPAIVPPNLSSENVIFTHHVYAVRRKMQIPNLFIYYLLQLKQYRDRVKGFATGTTVLALPKDAILDFTFIMPDNQTLDAFEDIANKLMEKTNSLKMQNENLARIRDLLLPKLMSGKIRVPVSNQNLEIE